MFKLVRWLFLLGIIAALAGFLVGKPIHGKTPAESFCKLIDNADCGKLAARGATEMAWLRTRWENASGGGSAPQTVKAEREIPAPKPHPAPPAAPPTAPETVPEPNPAAPPLDRHTVTERHALDRILSQRGSR